MENYKEMYEKLREEFETYQSFAESNIQMLNDKNLKLEKNLDALTNIVEVSKYINSYLSDENLIPMINDMIIGILGVTYSSVYIKEDGELNVKATNKLHNKKDLFSENLLKELQNGKPFVLNCKSPIFESKSDVENIHSLIGVPVHLRDKFIGYIIVEHSHYNFFGYDHIKFISSIANQIGIALENNFLYNKVKESAIRDPLLGIYNRKYLYDVVEAYISSNPKKIVAIIMMDMDHFKKVNDQYGHQFGDEVLIKTVGLIQRNISEEDIVARYGGEEIAICIKSMDSTQDVFKKIDNIRDKISKNLVCYNNVQKTNTASFGISYYPIDGQTIQTIMNAADARLYIAKNSGRNKVVDSSI
jgi:diguanylate cyclase (GGDEF)-like protein